MTSLPEAPAPGAEPEARLSPWQRAGRVFGRPAAAWQGLEHQVQWWMPLVLITVLQTVLSLATYRRVLVPMMLDQWDQAVANGSMQPEQASRMSDFFTHNPLAPVLVVGQQVIFLPVIVLFVALVLWFGCGFVLGTRFRYRQALEVVCWSSLVRVPETILTFVVGWFMQTFKGVHFGLAALLPEPETPNKLHSALAVLLDAIGPFSAWFVVVAVLGAAALSGAPRKNVAWVMVALYLALAVFFAAVAAMFTPGA